MTLKRIALCTLLLASSASLADNVNATISGRLTFINDEGTFLLDMGILPITKSLGGKLAGIKGKEGAAAAVRKLIPTDARIQFKVTKTGAYPEGLLYFNGKDIAEWLVSKGLATRIKP